MTDFKLAADLVLPRAAVTQKLAWLGRTGSGKSYASTKMAEQMIGAGAQIIVLDPVGIWYGLRLTADAYLEKLQDIAEEEARAEGVECLGGVWRNYLLRTLEHCETARESFQTLWESLHRKDGRGWGTNPEVVVLSLKLIECQTRRCASWD